MFYCKNLKLNNNIEHCFFSRNNGASKGIYRSLNCGIGSNDDASVVVKNLEIVSNKIKIRTDKLILMNQTHSSNVEVIKNINNLNKIKADAMLTKENSIALGVLTADCAPILIYETDIGIAGCIHAGWKGAVNGIIENTLKKIVEMGGSSEKVIVSVGPCIAQKSYEVKEDFYSMFLLKSDENKMFFFQNDKKTFNFDLRGFVNKKFRDHGVSQIENLTLDTFASENDYFSHRRAKKLGENDYGRCISVIKKIS